MKKFIFPKVGTYIIRNSLAQIAQSEWLLFFDVDDIMMPDLTLKLHKYMDDCDAIRFKFLTFYGNKRKFSIIPDMQAKGAFAIRKEKFLEYNGFIAWVCTADAEFEARTAKELSTTYLEDRLFWRRKHSKQLTSCPEYGMHTAIRHEHIAKIYDNIENPVLPEITVSTFHKFQ